jgi:F0F1-type ATP synthase assembly protein I
MAGIFGYDMKLRGLIIFSNLVVIAVFVGLGWLVDLQFETKPVYIVIGLAASFPINQLASYRIIKWYTRNKQHGKPEDLVFEDKK